MPDTKEEAKKIVLSFFENDLPSLKLSNSIGQFITNILWIAEELGTPAERKTIHRLTKRLNEKYDSKIS